MIEKPKDIVSLFPIRKTGKQKKLFRQEVTAYCSTLGYPCRTEKTGFHGQNIIIGDPKSAKHLMTAHYDTCATMFLPNFITPCNFWLFLLYQIVLVAAMMIPAILLCTVAFIISKDIRLMSVVFMADLFVSMLLMLYGPANKHNANDNTSGVVTVLEIAAALPEEYKSQVCFVLFDLEEAGLVGSSAYRTAHKHETNHQIIWNFDCVGDGDEILFFPRRKVKKNPDTAKLLELCQASQGKKKVSVCKDFYIYPSDQVNFPGGIGIAAMNRGKFGLYLDKIHTAKDTALDEENIKILRDTMLSVIAAREE